MRDSSMLLSAALLCSSLGAVWLASAIDAHWRQLRNAPIAPRQARLLRSLGALAWLGSLWLCCQADHVLMAVLVWIMSIAAASFGVALTLAWRPSALAWLSGWLVARI